ncbi:MAG TPA: hypothetical protein ENJ18_18955 [Nannocystis exedens]|nr:hypothetical protein [Nannocystis exedens]
MPKPVAVEGDTAVETSTAKLQADTNQTGSWQLLMSNNVLRGAKVSVGGKAVEISAEATWMYVGGTAGTPPVPVPVVASDQAQIRGTSTVLTDSGDPILLDGDQATGMLDSGDKISVVTSQEILSTD